MTDKRVKLNFKFDAQENGYVRVSVSGTSNYIPTKVLRPGDTYNFDLDVTKIVGTMTEKEIIRKLVSIIDRSTSDIYDLVGSELYHVLEDNGYWP